jgi:predicted ATP-grasp superfamily ATP-dependent carboligase
MALNGARPSGPILIGSAEALAGPESALSLLAAGLPVAAFTRRGARPALRRHPQVVIHGLTAPEHDAAAAVEELRALARSLGAVALMALDDSAVWLCDRAAAGLGLPVIGATGEQAELALDKRRQIELARAAGLPVPPTHVFEAPEEALALDTFPLVLKPALALEEHDGRLGKGSAKVCADRDELSAAVAGWAGRGPILSQPWIAGTGEGLFGIAAGGETLHWSAHRRLRMVNPQGSGSSACASAVPDPALIAGGARMMAAGGWDGLFMLEFLRDRAGAPWFMELNGRTWGSLALARRLGLEYPAWAALDKLGIATPPAVAPKPPDGRELVCRHLGREILHTLSVLRGPRSAALDEWPSRWETVRAVARVRRAERWYNWSPRHPGIFLDDTLQTVLAAAPRRSR